MQQVGGKRKEAADWGLLLLVFCVKRNKIEGEEFVGKREFISG